MFVQLVTGTLEAIRMIFETAISQIMAEIAALIFALGF